MRAVEFRWGDVFVCEPDWSWSVRELPHLDLWYVAGGVAWIRDASDPDTTASIDPRTPGALAIAAGDCLLLRRGASYVAGHDRTHPLRLIAVHFDFLDELGPAALPPFARRMEAGALVETVLTRAIEAYRDDDRRAASAWLQAAVLEVLRQDARSHPPGHRGDQAHQIEAICERIRRQPGQPLRVHELARELEISPEHFCRLFRELQGLAPRAFITQTRIEAARTLLLTSSHSIERIAALLGYDGPFHFSRQFKAKVGVAPSQFRRQR